MREAIAVAVARLDQVRAHRLVERLQGHAPGLHLGGEMLVVDVAHHVHVDARQKRLAGGFGIVNAESREALIETLSQQILKMGEGSVEFINYNQFYPAPEASFAPATSTAYPAGVIPYLSFDNATDVIAFYIKAFGAKEIGALSGMVLLPVRYRPATTDSARKRFAATA